MSRQPPDAPAPILRKGVRLDELRLTPEEGLLLRKIDGTTELPDLARSTGLAHDRIREMVDRLRDAEILAPPSEATPRGEPPGAHATAGRPSELPRETPWDPRDREDDGTGEEDPEGDAEGIGDHEDRKRFEVELRPLPEDRRVEIARAGAPRELRALCHDPSRRVVTALLENPRFGLGIARRLARHHPSGPGLEALTRRSEFLLDRQVQSKLFQNSRVTDLVLSRVFARYRMSQVYRTTLRHDVTGSVRHRAMKAFRKKFAEGSAEERVRLILETEGRCLAQLAGVALGAKATALLVRRPLQSTLLIRNLCRWPSTTPPVLRHLARQPAVRRSPQLRNLVLQHPNAPTSLRTER